MNARTLRTVLAHAAAAAGGPDAADGELLARVATARDEAAFAELVRRHGRLVWAVCRHLSPTESDADDAFQATFLALWQGAGRVRATGTAAPWLHAVAHRVATRAKRTAARRIAREKKAATGEADSRPPPSAWDATMTAVHEEVAALPDAQRTAFVLCVLDGVGVSEAAGRLGWKLGTLSGRLTRAKQTLLDRLAKRGIPAAAAGAVLVGPAGPVPAAVLAKGIGLPVATVPSTISSLAQGVTGMAMTRIKLLAAGLLVAGGLTAGLGGGGTTAADPPKPTPGPPERLDEAKKARLKDEEFTARAQALLTQAMAQAVASPAGKWEYDFLTFPQSKPGVPTFPDPDAYRKLFREKEAQGWEFVGGLTAKVNTGTRDGGVKAADEPVMVFRRPAKGAESGDVSAAWQYLLRAESAHPASPLFNQTYLSTSLPLLREYLADRLRRNPGAKFSPTLDAALAETPAWKPLVDRYGRTTLEADVMAALAEGYRKEAATGEKPGGDIVGILRPVLVATLRQNPGTKFGVALDAVLATNPAYRPAVEAFGRTTLEAAVMTELAAGYRADAEAARAKAEGATRMLVKQIESTDPPAAASVTVGWPSGLGKDDFFKLLTTASRKRFPDASFRVGLNVRGERMEIVGPKEQVEWAAGLAKQLTGEK